MTRPRRLAATMSCAVVTAVAAAVVTAGCGADAPPPPAPPPPAAAPVAGDGPVEPRRVPAGQELNAFQRALAMRSLVVGGSDQETTEYARAICSRIDASTPIDQVIVDIQQGTATRLGDTGYILGAAVSSFCPGNLAKLPR